MLVSWNTTNECNLRCRHCYRDAKDRVQGELTTEEGRALISEVARAGFKIMIFSGGEPLSRPDITELTAHAAGLGLKPVFGTNGTLLTADLARRLKEAGARMMGISLDSVDPAKHDEWRGMPGSWRAAVEGMRVCRETGLPFQINTTVVDWNYGEIDALTDFAVRMGAAAHHIFFLVPAGRAVDVEKESLRAAQYEELLRRILARQEQVGIELKPTCAPQFMRIAREMGIKTRFQRGCLAGIAYCVVDPRGNVLPCAYLQIPAGNVRKTPFSEIWAKSPLFGELRAQRYKGSCGACAYRKICGGCRARAYYYSGDYLGEEPWCAGREQEGTAADA